MNRIYVVGAGGIGCAVGYFLRAGGWAVTFVDADRAKVDWGQTHGVQVDKRPPLPADFQLFEDWSPSADAIVLLCTKCYDNAAVLARLPSTSRLVPIQNGFDPELPVRDDCPEGIASFVSECHPGRTHTRITRGGKLHFGYRGNKEGPPEEGFIALLRKTAPFPIVTVPDILPFKYTKLMYNAAISPLAAAAGLDNGELLWHRRARRLFFALLRENYAILKGAGIGLAKIGPFHPDTVSRILSRSPLANALAWAFYPSLRGSYCSMSGDLPMGRTEIDYYNRYLIDMAGDRPCPWNRRVYDLLRRMETERIAPGLSALAELESSDLTSDPMFS